jgi:hypothetical protein
MTLFSEATVPLTAVARGVIEEATVRDRVAQHSNVVRLQGVSRRFGQTQALRNVSLTVTKRRNPWPDWAQRRRKIDADSLSQRAGAARRRRNRD